MGSSIKVLVVGGSPERSSAETLRCAARGVAHVVAVDRGLDAAVEARLDIDLFCGDADTVSVEGLAYVRAQEGEGGALEVERYNPHKDFTDLSLALRAVSERWPGADVICCDLTGGASDHYLGVLGCLMRYNGSVRMLEDGMEARLLHGGDSWVIEGHAGERFSIVALAEGTVVSEAGLRWEIDRVELPPLGDRGISNVVEKDSATVTCHAGCAIAYLFA